MIYPDYEANLYTTNGIKTNKGKYETGKIN